jgi:hypothetical protein
VLAPHLAKLVSLTSLDLTHNEIHAEGAQALAPHPAPPLATLRLNWNAIGPEEVPEPSLPILAQLLGSPELNVGCNVMGGCGRTGPRPPHLGCLWPHISTAVLEPYWSRDWLKPLLILKYLQLSNVLRATQTHLHLAWPTHQSAAAPGCPGTSLELGGHRPSPHYGVTRALTGLACKRIGWDLAGSQALAPHWPVSPVSRLNLHSNAIGPQAPGGPHLARLATSAACIFDPS